MTGDGRSRRPRRSPAPRADAGALPGRDRVRRARRRPRLLGALRRGRADDPAHADVVDRPLAALEGADRLLRAALPRRDLRRPRQRPLGPPDRRRAPTRTASSPPTPCAVLDATGDGAAVVAGLSMGAGLCAARRRRASRARPRPGLLRPGGRRSVRPADRRRGAVRGPPQPADEGWAKYNATSGGATGRGFAEWFSGDAFTEPHSTKQIEDAVGWGLETDPETLIADHDASSPTLDRDDARRPLCCARSAARRWSSTATPTGHRRRPRGRRSPSAIPGAPLLRSTAAATRRSAATRSWPTC